MSYRSRDRDEEMLSDKENLDENIQKSNACSRTGLLASSGQRELVSEVTRDESPCGTNLSDPGEAKGHGEMTHYIQRQIYRSDNNSVRSAGGGGNESEKMSEMEECSCLPKVTSHTAGPMLSQLPVTKQQIDRNITAEHIRFGEDRGLRTTTTDVLSSLSAAWSESPEPTAIHTGSWASSGG